jgi:hypothetical protein
LLFGSKKQRRYHDAFPRINAAAAVNASFSFTGGRKSSNGMVALPVLLC